MGIYDISEVLISFILGIHAWLYNSPLKKFGVPLFCFPQLTLKIYIFTNSLQLLFSPLACHWLSYFMFSIVTIVTSMSCYLIVVLICIFLIISEAELLSCICWPFVYLHFNNMYSCSSHLFNGTFIFVY